MSTPDDRTPDPASIASASFTTVRRGLDPNEVRAYLQRLAADMQVVTSREATLRRELEELKAQPGRGELDEAIVAAWLGEEAARVLTTARDAAGQVKGKAQDYADQLREEVAAEVAHLRDDAHAEVTQLRDDAYAEVAQLREEVAAEVARRREESLAEAEVEIETARQEGRSMVSEARAVRERMLADLARRRDGARAQLTALRGERDRIVNAIEATRDHLDRLMDDLRAASPEDDRELPPVPYEQDLRAVTTSEPRLTLVRPLHPVHQDRELDPTGVPTDEVLGDPVFADDEVPVTGPGAEDVAESTGGSVGDEGMVEPDRDAEAAEVADALADALADDRADFADGGPPGDSREQPPAFDADPAGLYAGELIESVEPVQESGAVPGEDDDAVAWAPTAEEGDPLAEHETGEVDEADRPSVDDLFARIRAARSDAVGPVDTPTGEMPTGDTPTGEVLAAEVPAVGATPGDAGPDQVAADDGEPDEPVDHETAILRARDAAISPLRATLARQLKRALADEQNEVFDRLRRVSKVEGADEVLGTEAAHAERYRASGEDAVWAAALAGAASTAPDTETPGALEGALERHRVLDEVLDEVTLEVAMPLRERLEAAIVGGGRDPDDATSLLRNAYREWKAQRIDELAAELVLSAYGRGAFAAAPLGEPVRWIVDPAAPGCRDEMVNADAGPLPCGEAFPTGHRHPPAHAGCRCLLELTHG